jgi:hypothetical protein
VGLTQEFYHLSRGSAQAVRFASNFCSSDGRAQARDSILEQIGSPPES